MTAVLSLCALVLPVPALIGGMAWFAKKRQVLPCALICAIAISAVVSGFQTTSELDLWRYVQYTNMLKGISLGDAFSYSYGNLPLITIWFWIAAQVGNPFMQASVAFIDYFIAFYIVFDVSKCENLNGRQFVLACSCLLLLLPIFDSTNSLRSSPALLLGILGLYLNVVRNDSRSIVPWILMIIPIFIHSIGYVILIIRLFIVLFGKSLRITFFATVLIIPVGVALSNLTGSIFESIGVNPFALLIQYTEWTTGYAEAVANSHYHQILRLINVALLILLAFDIFYVSNRDDIKDIAFLRNLKILLMMLTGIEIGLALFIMTPSYLRFCYASAPLIAAYLACTRKHRTTSLGIFLHLLLILFICAVAILYLYSMFYYVNHEPLLKSLSFGYLGLLPAEL